MGDSQRKLRALRADILGLHMLFSWAPHGGRADGRPGPGVGRGMFEWLVGGAGAAHTTPSASKLAQAGQRALAESEGWLEAPDWRVPVVAVLASVAFVLSFTLSNAWSVGVNPWITDPGEV